jgi:hypothetical protein
MIGPQRQPASLRQVVAQTKQAGIAMDRLDETKITETGSRSTNRRLVAVLCVSRSSVYKQIELADCYDIIRDANTFGGGMPVVAHPPCRAWSAFCSHQAKPKVGEKDLAPMCVEWLKQCGGVLEHPAYSKLWDYCGLPKPGERMRCGMWSARVSQAWWGDTRMKQTWLLFAGISPSQIDIPYRLHCASGDRGRWNTMSRHKRAATPPLFAHWLIDAAISSSVE